MTGIRNFAAAILGIMVLFGSVSCGPDRVTAVKGRQQAIDNLLTGEFSWNVSRPLVEPLQREGDFTYSVKDPSIVRYKDRWHLFCTLRGKERSHRIEYISFDDWDNVESAERHYLNITDGYYCAPQVFYFEPHKKWYLIYQTVRKPRTPALQPAWSTTDDISNPGSWSKPTLLFEENPDNVRMWIDFWVICDDSRAHFFFTSLNGKMWRSETSLEDFPRGWSRPEVVLEGDIFEAGHTYRLKGMEKYLTVVEAQSPGRRYYKAYIADRLDGEWRPVAATREKPFASPVNTHDTSEHWTDSFSHGELIRAGYNQRLEVDPAEVKLLFQGVTDERKIGKQYGEIPWRLGILEPVRPGLEKAKSKTVYYPLPESQGGWRKNTNADFIRSLNVDPVKLEKFGEYNLSVPSSQWMPYAGYKGIMVIKDGWVIGEWYNRPEAETFKTYISSNGKAFATMGFGIMNRDGERGDIGLKIGQGSKVYDRRWLHEGFPLSDERKEQITFEQIFRHNSGLCPERTGTGENVEKGRNKWTDYTEWIFGRDAKWPETGKLYFEPGRPEQYEGVDNKAGNYIAYSSVGYGHLGFVFRNVYGVPAREFLWERLLKPIGFSGIDYHAPPNDEIKWFSAGGLRMTPRDYARFAYFLLQDGKWGDEQIVSPEWVQRFRLFRYYPNIRSNADGYFGEQYPRDMFRIAGSGLNWAFIVPSMDLIALRTSRVDNSRWEEVEKKFLRKLFAAVGEVEEIDEARRVASQSRIVVDPERGQWLMREGGKPFFMCGPGDPEGFLYRGELNADGTRSGDQEELIEKMEGTGANCIYLMAIRSHGGDGEATHNPFIDNDPAKGVNSKVLDQWEKWFTTMDEYGIVIYLFIYDDAINVGKNLGWPLSDSGQLNSGEKDFLETLVNRFEHHKNLIWCVMEEVEEMGDDYKEHTRKITAAIREADDNKHAIAVHQLNGLSFHFQDEPNVDQFAIQYNVETAREMHDGTVQAWKEAAGRYSLNMSEVKSHTVGGRTPTRKKSWACAMGGAYVMIIEMDIASTTIGELEDCGRLVRFLESTNFYEMSPHDELRNGGTEYVLAQPGRSYIAYASDLNGKIGLRGISRGKYDFRWFDCATGKEVLQSGVTVAAGDRMWYKPAGISNELAVYIKRVEK